MKDEKNYFTDSFQTELNLNYFVKGKTLNKTYIINKISNNPKFKDYLLDVSAMSISRDYLLNFVHLTFLVSSISWTNII